MTTTRIVNLKAPRPAVAAPEVSAQAQQIPWFPGRRLSSRRVSYRLVSPCPPRPDFQPIPGSTSPANTPIENPSGRPCLRHRRIQLNPWFCRG